jgi:ribose/xylose/arabinose/galactoside ABC-type transport system permease subunit
METAVLNTSSTKENVAIFLLRSVPEYSCSHFVLCLPGILYCFCNVPITCSVTWHRKITWLRARSMLITYPVMFNMFWGSLILRNSTKLYTGPIKLKINELLCLTWLESELTTRQYFLHLCMSSLWLCVCVCVFSIVTQQKDVLQWLSSIRATVL